MRVGLLAMMFWLVTSSASPGSPTHFIKLSREKMQAIFVFGDEDRSNWYLTLAEKRLSEADTVIKHGWKNLAKNQILMANKYYQMGNESLKPLIDKADINYLLDKSERIKQQLETLK